LERWWREVCLFTSPYKLERRLRSHLEEEAHAEARRQRWRAGNLDYHWVSELHGWYDTDEECEERNTNDDLLNML